MLGVVRTLVQRPFLTSLAWSMLVTLALAFPIARPFVQPQGVTVREDTTNFTTFPMTDQTYAAIAGAVEAGRLVQSDLQDGFKFFTGDTLSKRQLATRVRVGGRVIDQYLAEQRAAARPTLIGLWAALAL